MQSQSAQQIMSFVIGAAALIRLASGVFFPSELVLNYAFLLLEEIAIVALDDDSRMIATYLQLFEAILQQLP